VRRYGELRRGRELECYGRCRCEGFVGLGGLGVLGHFGGWADVSGVTWVDRWRSRVEQIYGFVSP
jgi:hypothetical protein